MLQHENNLYTKLNFNQQWAIYKTLLVQRHSMDVLLQEHFPLGNEPLDEHKARKGLYIEDFAWAPKKHPSIQKRKAVAIHCLLAIVAVDFLSGEILINSRVVPNVGWNGSSRSESLHGWREARVNLFDFIDQDTIIVGHRTQVTLEMLRLLHKQIVDSQILAASALYYYKPSLEKVCAEFVGIRIRQGATCPLENALAAREIVLHYILRPKDAIWARETKTNYWRAQEEKNYKRSYNPVLDNSGPVAAHDGKYQGSYQDAYEAGFASGFKVGYKRRYEQAGFPGDYAEVEKASRAVKRQKTHARIQDTGENENPGHHEENASQKNNTDMNQVARARSLLTHLMKDTKIKEIIQMLNQAQRETSKESETVSCQTVI
ncbi:hypothetical protein GGI43DRAFT_427485 [Trichoderma evansii]